MKVDMLVIGAGPAGCAAAIVGAREGLKVALVEGAAFPRNAPGEALHPDVDELLDELGVAGAVAKAGFVRYPGWMLVRKGKPQFIPFGNGSGLQFGYQAWRADFDAILLRQAREVGVTVRQPMRVKDVVVRSKRVVAVKADDEEIAFRHVVDASGPNSVVRRNLGLAVKTISPPLVARYGYGRGGEELGVIPEFHEHASGWTWLARVKSDCCQFVRLALDKGSQKDETPAPIAGAKTRGANVTWRWVPQCAGPGYFLSGDAASTLDPSAASGVARALASGKKAAESIVQIHRRRVEQEQAMRAYRDWTREQFESHARQLAERYSQLKQVPGWVRQSKELLSK